MAHRLRTLVLVDAALFVPYLVGVGATWRDLAKEIRDDTQSSESALPILQVFGLVALAAAIFRLIWLMRAAEAGKRLGRPARREPGLAGAGWIIPIVNFWWPYQDVKALIPPEHPDHRRVGWWWGFHLTGQLSFIAVIIAGFLPIGVQVAAVAVGALAYMAAALIERDLIATIVASHEEWLHRSSA